MTTNARAFATELAGHFHTDEDRASIVHHPGQMTVGDYQSLDKVEPREITGFARVQTTPSPHGVFEYLGLDADGWLARAEPEVARYEPLAAQRRYEPLRALPFMRLVDEQTGFAFSDPESVDCRSTKRAKVMDVPPLDTSHAPESVRPDARDTPPHRGRRLPMSARTLIPDDPDPVASARGIDLGDAGLPGYCAAVTIGADGCEHLALLKYNAGEADYLPLGWTAVAPHEIPGLPVYRKEA